MEGQGGQERALGPTSTSEKGQSAKGAKRGEFSEKALEPHPSSLLKLVRRAGK